VGDGAGVTIDRYELHGVPVFVATDDEHVLVSPSDAVISHALAARRDGATLRQDPFFGRLLAAVGEDSSQAAAWNIGRIAELVTPFLGEHERRQALPVLQLLADTSVSLRVSQSDRRLAIAGRISGLPDIRPMIEQHLRRMRGQPSPGTRTIVAPDPAP